MPGQNRKTLALFRQLSIPRWLECTCFIMWGLSATGTIKRFPSKRIPSWMLSSSLKSKYPLISDGTSSLVSGQPCNLDNMFQLLKTFVKFSFSSQIPSDFNSSKLGTFHFSLANAYNSASFKRKNGLKITVFAHSQTTNKLVNDCQRFPESE